MAAAKNASQDANPNGHYREHRFVAARNLQPLGCAWAGGTDLQSKAGEQLLFLAKPLGIY